MIRERVEGVGSRMADAVRLAGGVFILFLQTLGWIVRPPFRIRHTLEQMVKIGVESLPIATLTNFFIGVVIALQSAYQMKKVAAEMYIPSLV